MFYSCPQARKAVIDHSAKLLREDNALDLNYVVLDLPCTFFMLRSLRCRAGFEFTIQSMTSLPLPCQLAQV